MRENGLPGKPTSEKDSRMSHDAAIDGMTKRGKDRVKGLLVTNDVKESGVALVQELRAKGRTKPEDQLPYMIQAAGEHLRTYVKASDKLKFQ